MVRLIRRQDTGRAVLICGPWHGTPDTQRLLEAGADDYLPLPCETAALGLRLQVLAARAARDSWVKGSTRLEKRRLMAHSVETLAGLAGRIAHEYNNLLSAVQGNAELALLNLSLDSSTRYSLEQIRDSSRRAADLTRQVQALASRRAGEEMVPLSLSQLIRDSADLLRVSVSRNCRLDYQLDSALLKIHGDASRLRQMLVALVMNASEAMGDEGGEIRIRTFGGSAAPDDRVYLEVEDTGPGIEPALKENIFSPFFSTKGTRRGLGLAAARAIANAHGAAIEALPGRGGLFRVSFPVPVEGTSTGTGLNMAVHQGTVLLIEDEDSVRMAAHQQLRQAGYVVFESASGADALEVFGHVAGALDAVILDLSLPGMDGGDVVTAMREVRPDLRIVVCRSPGEKGANGSVLGMGDVAYIDKPVQLEAFMAVLQRALAA